MGFYADKQSIKCVIRVLEKTICECRSGKLQAY